MERKYSISDSELFEHADKVDASLDEDLVEFMNFDSTLNEDKKQELKTKKANAELLNSDRQVAGEIKGLTTSVKSLLKDAKAAYRKLRYFVKKKFKNNPGVLKEFGVKEYAKVSQSQDEMITFLVKLDSTIEKYREDLTAAGAQPETMDQLKTIAAEFRGQNVAQEIAKDKRPTTTNERVAALNQLYDILLEFSAAAGEVYKKNPSKRKQYSLPAKPRKK